MTTDEKILIHQIHPLKFYTDFFSAIVALYFFWSQNVVVALIVSIIPPIIASIVVILFVNLEKYKGAALGKYFLKNMTPGRQFIRLLGFVIMAISALRHSFLFILVGAIVIVAGWFAGI